MMSRRGRGCRSCSGFIAILFAGVAFGQPDRPSPAAQILIPGGQDACGRNCLYVALKSLDVPVQSLSALEEKIGPPPVGGYELQRLKEGAEAFGLHALGVETTVENLSRRPDRFACIAHYQRGHFVLVTDVFEQNRGVVVIDPPQDPAVIPRETFEHQWSGHALLIGLAPLIAEEDLPRPYSWRRLDWIVAGVVLVGLAFLLARKRRRGAAKVAACLSLVMAGCDSKTPDVTAHFATVPALDQPAIVIDDVKRNLGELIVTGDHPPVEISIDNAIPGLTADLTTQAVTGVRFINVRWDRPQEPGDDHSTIQIVIAVPGDETRTLRIPVSGIVLGESN